MSEALDFLLTLLDLETIEVNTYRGQHPKEERQRTFGGQVAAQALMAMGALPQPGGAKKMDIGLARFFIDSLAVLEEKTKGNLTAGEQRSLLSALTDLRMTYVNVLKKSGR